MNISKSAEEFECEAASYALVSAVLRSMPHEEWLGNLAKEKTLEEICFADDQEDIIEGKRILEAWSNEYDKNSFDEVYADCMNLFIGPGAPLAPPWESVYIEGGEGLVFQKETLNVRQWYRSFALQVDNLHHEPDDHIAYELQFLSELSKEAAEAVSKEDYEAVNHFVLSKKQFIDQHVAVWVFDWCTLVSEKAATGFYRGIAHLIRGFLAESRKETL